MRSYTFDYPSPGLPAQEAATFLTEAATTPYTAEVRNPVPDGPFAEPVQDFREGWAALQERWQDMDPSARCLYVGSGVVSAAVFGYLTVKCGPIPSVRKLLANLPDYVGRDTREWAVCAARNLTASTRGAAAGGEGRRRHRALAVVAMLAATSLHPIQTTPVDTVQLQPSTYRLTADLQCNTLNR